MKYCEDCGYHLLPETASGELIYKCDKCFKKYPSEDIDTLRYEISFMTAESSEKYSVLERNAPHDLAANRIDKQCPKCKLPYMTKIYEGRAYSMKLLCDCGHVE